MAETDLGTSKSKDTALDTELKALYKELKLKGK